MKFGYQLSSITPYLDTKEHLRDSLQKIADIGYKYVQLQGVPADMDDGIIASALREAGLVCVGTQEDYILSFGDDPKRYIDRAKAVGAKYLAFALLPFELDTAKELSEFVREKTTPIARMAEAEGLVFSFHPISYDYRALDGVPAYEIVMENLPESVHLTFCVSACFETPVTPEDVFAHFGGKIEMVHFKDYVLDTEGKQVLTTLGQGLHDWVPYVQLCRDHGIEYIFGEQERWQKDAFESAKDTFDYLQSLELQSK